MNCPNCGTKQKPGSLFCHNCGSRVAEGEASFASPVQVPSKRKRRRTPVILVSVIAALVLLGALGCWLLLLGEEVQELPIRQPETIPAEEAVSSKEEAVVEPVEPEVTDAACETLWQNVVYRVPMLKLDGVSTEEVNAAIYDTLYPQIEELMEYEAEGGPFNGGCPVAINYEWICKKDVVSILAWSGPLAGGTINYYSWNVSAKTGELLSVAEVVRTFGMTEEEFYSKARTLMVGKVRTNNPYLTDEDFQKGKEETGAQENLDKVRLYINAEGSLCIAARIQTFAGAGMYYELYELENGEMDDSGYQGIPEPDSQPELPTDALRIGQEITVSGAVQYSNEPSDIGEEYCFFDVPSYSYIYEGIDYEQCANETDVIFTRGKATELLKDYIGQSVEIKGVFGSEMHGIPYIDNITVVTGTKTQEENTGFHTGYQAYDEKLEEYAEALSLPEEMFQGKYDYGHDCSSINALCIYPDTKLSYALYDFDKNGTPELFIGTEWGLIDLYLLKDDSCVRPFVGDSFGYRANLHLLRDGRMRLDGSSGAASGTCEFYRIGEDGGTLIMEEAYYWDGMFGRDEYLDATHTYITIEEGDLNPLYADEEIDILAEMSWMPITEMSSDGFGGR